MRELEAFYCSDEDTKMLVEFKDGTFGVRQRHFIFWFVFVDLVNPEFKWSKTSKWFKDCKGTKEQAINAMNYRCDWGRPVKL